MTALRRILAGLVLGVIFCFSIAAIVMPQSAHAQLLQDSRVDAVGKSQCIYNGQLDPKNVAPCIDPSNQDFPFILNTWKWSLGVINIFAVIVLIIMAFANIIYPWKFLEPYRIRQLLPEFIWGIILANISLFICRGVVSLADLLLSSSGLQISLTQLFTAWKIDPAALNVGIIQAKFGTNSFTNGGAISENSLSNTGKMIYQLLLATALVYLPIFALLALSFIFYLRFALIFVLTAVSPLAFGAIMFPATKKYLTTWWDTFWKWCFGGVASYLLFFMSMQVAKTNNHGSLADATYVDIIPYGIGLFLIYLAVQAPFKLGGAAAAMYQKAAGWAFRQTKNLGTGLAKDWEQTRKDSIVSRAYGDIGRWGARLHQAGKSELSDEYDRFDQAGGKKNWRARIAGNLKKGVGGFINSTNRYGANEAKERQKEYYEGTRKYASRFSSGVYQKILGEEAGLKYHEADNAARFNDMPLDVVKAKYGAIEARIKGEKTWDDLSSTEQDKFLRGGLDQGVKYGRQLGLRGAEDIDTYKLLRRREAQLEKQRTLQADAYREAMGLGPGGGPHGVPAAAPSAPPAASGSAPTGGPAPASGPHGVAVAPPPTPTQVAPTTTATPPAAHSAPAPGTGTIAAPHTTTANNALANPATPGEATGVGVPVGRTTYQKPFSTARPTGVGAAASTAAVASLASVKHTPETGTHSYMGAPIAAQPHSGPAPSAIGIAAAPAGPQQLGGSIQSSTSQARSSGVQDLSGRARSITSITSAAKGSAASQTVVGTAIPGKGPAAVSTTGPKTPAQIVQRQQTVQTTRPSATLTAPAPTQQQPTVVTQSSVVTSNPTASQTVVGAPPAPAQQRTAQEVRVDVANYDVKQAEARSLGPQRSAEEIHAHIAQYDARHPQVAIEHAASAPATQVVASSAVVQTSAPVTTTQTYATGSGSAAASASWAAQAQTESAAASAQYVQHEAAEHAKNVAQRQSENQIISQVNAPQQTAAQAAPAPAPQKKGFLRKAAEIINNSVAKQQTYRKQDADAVKQTLMKAAAAGGTGSVRERAATDYQTKINQLAQEHKLKSEQLAEVTQRVNDQLQISNAAPVDPDQKDYMRQKGFDKADESLRRQMISLQRERDQTQQDIATYQRQLQQLQNQQP